MASKIIEKLDKLFGDPSVKYIKNIQPLVNQINSLEQEYEKLTDEQLKGKTQEFKDRIAKGETLDEILVEAFATVREASKRVIGQRHYDVQLIGGITLHRGDIAEMRTGEGKTLTSTLPVYLNALTGKGVHLVTVNDYLARRDCSWMGQVYNFLGLSVSCIQNQRVTFIYDHNAKADADEVDENRDGLLDDSEKENLVKMETIHTFKVDMDRLRKVENRALAYQADVTYGTNNEFGFDYLRDNMEQRKSEKTQHGLNFAIVDEVDSILIDEARTPLIISAPDAQSTSHYITYKNVVSGLQDNKDYSIDEKMKSVGFTEEGQDNVARLLGRDPWHDMDYQTTFHLEAALKAKALFTREKDYVVQNGEVIIVDEFTGRMMPGRRYSEGLHQALEAKEGVEIQKESKTMATITFQNLFRMYEKLSGMTGTAETEKEEFLKIYGLDVVVIPTNKVTQRKDLNDLIYKTEKAKFLAVVEEVKRRNATGQPILIGTISIERNEYLANLLEKAGVTFKALNAKNHESEAEIIAQAGKKYSVTLATNMAGRGVDIVLGGIDNDPKASNEVKELGGLHVIGTERHESRRIDNQLRGRTGRQGDIGSSQFFVSLEDDLMRIFGSDRVRSIMDTLKVPDDMPIENKYISKSLESAQKKVEGNNFDVRKRLVEYDDVINKQRTAIYELRNKVLDAQESENPHEIYKEMIMDMIESEFESIVLFHTASENEFKWELKEVYESVSTVLPIGDVQKKTLIEIRKEAQEAHHDAQTRTDIINYLLGLADDSYTELESKIENVSDLANIEKNILLRSIDQYWVIQLEDMQHLRSGIGLRGYGQKDPLVEYKKESFGLYNRLRSAIQSQIVHSIFKIAGTVIVQPTKISDNLIEQGAQKNMTKKTTDNANTAVNSLNAGVTNTYEGQKVGRNDECPCGSGKKYKKCHGA